MPMLTVYSVPREKEKDCPPDAENDLGAQIKINDRWISDWERGKPTPHNVQVAEGDSVTIYAKMSLKPGKCTWQPEPGLYPDVKVGKQDRAFCIPCVCTNASSLVRPLSGFYTAKRKDQNESFQIEMSFTRNADFCLVCDIYAPRAMDHAQAFLHTKPEPGNHGILHHPGDFMNQNAPLTEGFLQGTLVGPRGEKGTLRMILSLIPDASGMLKVQFGGFLSFGGIGDIETTFTSDKPVAWPSQVYA
jgi:hypothetical protein